MEWEERGGGGGEATMRKEKKYQNEINIELNLYNVSTIAI